MRSLVFLLLFPLLLPAQLKRYQFTENKMGSPFNLIFYHTDSAEAAVIARNCFAIVDTLNKIFSDYDTASEISSLSSGQGQLVPVSDELFNMLQLSGDAWKKSGKTFDITLGQLTRLWRKAGKEKQFPSAAEVEAAKAKTGFENIALSDSPRGIIIHTNIFFDFGGIVKGYAAQRVIAYLESKNIFHALADAGGDLVMGDAPPGKNGWIVGINLPAAENEIWDRRLELKNCAVATSGDMYRYTEYNGKRYSHIIDPRTGYGVTSRRNVTVIAKDGAAADWLATACSILPVKKAKRLIKKEKGALFIAAFENENTGIYTSKNMDSYFEKKLP